MKNQLHPRQTPGANISVIPNGWRLFLPAGDKGTYRLAQLDDYAHLVRHRFPWTPPRTLGLRARLSNADLPGTWGFGLWNDPFGIGLGFGGQPLRLPCLPQAAWFFHASPPNHLALRPGHPADGFFAGTFLSPRWPTILFAPAGPLLPLLAFRPLRRLLRQLAGKIVRQEGAAVRVNITEWHTYEITWRDEECLFRVDGKIILKASLSPRPPLALVLWIDNQYAAFTPDGDLSHGTLSNPEAWLEISDIAIL
ncbi:MAG: hypothetical protein JXB85_06765 [Anaerolineales bacterium]|nr:hypothetical protein [Anaerolineales bacterium]